MKKKLIIPLTIAILLIAGSLTYLTYNKTNIYLMAVKLKVLHPTAIVKNIEEFGAPRAARFLLINIGDERVCLYEFEDKESSEKAMALLTDGSPGEHLVLDIKDNFIVKYSGYNEKIVKQISHLLR